MAAFFTAAQRASASELLSGEKMRLMSQSARVSFVHDILASEYGGMFNARQHRELVRKALVELDNRLRRDESAATAIKWQKRKAVGKMVFAGVVVFGLLWLRASSAKA